MSYLVVVECTGFPSPCGELRVSDSRLPMYEGVSVAVEFPSPCGELRVSDLVLPLVFSKEEKGFRPLAGN